MANHDTWEDEGGALPVNKDEINHSRCQTIMFSYMDTVIRCRKKPGHKGHHEMDPKDYYKRDKATTAFMRKAVGFKDE